MPPTERDISEVSLRKTEFKFGQAEVKMTSVLQGESTVDI